MSQLIRPILRQMAESLHCTKDEYYINGENILEIYPNDIYKIKIKFNKDLVPETGAYKYKTIEYIVLQKDTDNIEDNGEFNTEILDRSFLGMNPGDEKTLNWYHMYNNTMRSCNDMNDVNINEIIPNTLTELDSIVYHFKNHK